MFIRTLKQAGLRFRTQKAMTSLAILIVNNDVALVPLNDAERYNVAAIKKVEASRSCL